MKIPKPASIPLSLYIHVPWCERKCPYCDFNSHDNLSHFNETAYVDALLDDLDQELTFANQRSIDSIFIGGGTPSLFSAKAYTRLLDEIGMRLDIKQAEVTLEANPGSSERDKFAGYRAAGINRLSIGTQSYDSTMLKKIGRAHNGDDALNAAQAAQQAGFDNFNLDIMFALPEQTLEQAIADIEIAISMQSSHLSCYQLTLEPQTAFYKQPPKLPDSDLAWDMQSAIQQRLQAAQFDQYEVSAYAREQQQCQHNLNYWQFGDYLGIGAGAHGKVSLADGSVMRYWKHKQPKAYLASHVKAEANKFYGVIKPIDSQALPFEFMLNALRLKHGFAEDLFFKRTGLPIEHIHSVIAQHEQQGLIKQENKQIKPTDRGYKFIDTMLNDYLA